MAAWVQLASGRCWRCPLSLNFVSSIVAGFVLCFMVMNMDTGPVTYLPLAHDSHFITDKYAESEFGQLRNLGRMHEACDER